MASDSAYSNASQPATHLRWHARKMMQRAARSRRVGLCSDRASALRRGRGSWRSASARYGGRTALALSLDHAECIGGMRAAGSTCPRSGTAAAGAGRAVRLACGGYTVSHPARHGVCGLSQVAGIGLCRAVRRSTRTAVEVAQIGAESRGCDPTAGGIGERSGGFRLRPDHHACHASRERYGAV